MVRRIKGASVPVVTAVRGAAAGIGCAIALLGDLIVCGESAYFYQAFRNIGLIPDGGSAYLLASAIGRVRAMEMMLLGTKVPAAQALEWGLVSRVVPDAELDATALALAQELASGPASLGLIRASAWAALESGFEAQLDRERVMQRAAGLTSDFNEGVAAFRAKRRPQFTGR
jgi:2-(1,2-epoxy-1,2-dihydrophenyl)acetyl-CoA isomerase